MGAEAGPEAGGPLPAPVVHRLCDCLVALAMPLPAAALLQLLQPPDHTGAPPAAHSHQPQDHSQQQAGQRSSS